MKNSTLRCSKATYSLTLSRKWSVFEVRLGPLAAEPKEKCVCFDGFPSVVHVMQEFSPLGLLSIFNVRGELFLGSDKLFDGLCYCLLLYLNPPFVSVCKQI